MQPMLEKLPLPKTTLLFRHPYPASAYAALAANQAWRTGGPGVILDLHTLRCTNNHPNHSRQFSTLFLQFLDKAVVIFPDQSALVGTLIGKNQLQVHPTLLKLRESFLPSGYTFVVARGRNPLKNLIDIPMDAFLVYKDYSDPQVSYVRPIPQDYPNLPMQPWLDLLKEDCLTIGALPLPWCDVPTPAIPGVVTHLQAEQAGLPADAIGHPYHVPAWLPQRGHSTDEHLALKAYCQDFASWLLYVYQDKVDRVTVRVQTLIPHDPAHRHAMNFTVFLNRIAGTAGHMPSSLSGDPTHFLGDNRHQWDPPPLSSPYGFTFEENGNGFAHRVLPITLADVHPKPLTAHEVLPLLERFGQNGFPI